MRMPSIKRVLVLAGLCALTIPLMGGGTECPKACIIEDADCELVCGHGLEGKCRFEGQALLCKDIKQDGIDAAPSRPATGAE